MLLLSAALLGSAAAAAASAPQGTLVPQGRYLMLDARIAGTPVRALLDSAAEMTLLDPAFASRARLIAGESVTGHGSGREAFRARLVPGVTIDALGLHLTKQTVAIADLGDVGRRLVGARLDVILGREIFDAARITVDIAGLRIAVVPRGHEPPGVRLPLAQEHGTDTLPVRIEDGSPVQAAFDLGNGRGVLIGARYAEQRNMLRDGRMVREEHGGGLGGEVRRAHFTLRSIEIAGLRLHAVPASIDAEPTASDANLGLDVLRNFRITVDFAQHSIWLAPRR